MVISKVPNGWKIVSTFFTNMETEMFQHSSHSEFVNKEYDFTNLMLMLRITVQTLHT